ncbi:MAG: MFS transporter [Candidatus Paceibacterota bacterium]|jgi:MFS family permease
MSFQLSPNHLLNRLFKKEADQFFVSMAIRRLALGMILIFEPIFIFIYFNHSISLTLLFFGAIHGIYGLLAVYGAKIMSKIGPKQSILISHFFFFGYYLCLFLLSYDSLFIFISLAIILKSIGMTLFWPAFHTDFCRFSENHHRGKVVGRLNVALMAPTIIAPVIGGWILAVFGYPVLFTTVLVVLLTSAIPMFLSRQVRIKYSDSYSQAWKRIFKKANKKTNFAFVFSHLEWGIDLYLWPIFMSVLAISYSSMGGITTFALAITTLFTLYMGKMSDRLIDRVRFLNIGSALTSISWVLRYFVTSSFPAFLAYSLYRICRTTASIPFQALLYEKASLKGAEMDEFIVYREILINVSRFFFFAILAAFFAVFDQINLVFLVAAAASLGFMFMGVPPKIMRAGWWSKK